MCEPRRNCGQQAELARAAENRTVKGAPSLAVPRRFVMEPREYALYAVLYLLTRLVYVLLRKGWPAEERR